MKMQLCAILSQLHRHKEALQQARDSSRLSHQLFKDLLSLCQLYVKKMETRDATLNSFQILPNLHLLDAEPSTAEESGVVHTP